MPFQLHEYLSTYLCNSQDFPTPLASCHFAIRKGGLQEKYQKGLRRDELEVYGVWNTGFSHDPAA